LQLSIIIVNYNVKHLLEECLTSVETACKNISAEIFVVDNASTDGSQEYFNGKFSNVHFLWNRENVGFAKAKLTCPSYSMMPLRASSKALTNSLLTQLVGVMN
jgi:glycosyltransferase involved in cell wall biosynthesis